MDDESQGYLRELIELEKNNSPIMLFETFQEARAYTYSWKINAHPFGTDVHIFEIDGKFLVACKDIIKLAKGPFNPTQWLQADVLYLRINGTLY